MRKNLKRLTALLMCLCLLCPLGLNALAAAPEYVQISGFDPEVDYSARMIKCAKDGSYYALQMGWVYEQQRNLKIDTLKMSYEKSSYFTDYATGEEILAAMNRPKKLARMKKEYPVAAEVYEYLNKKGFSDAVIAGIIGNMMAEVGGHTLDLSGWEHWSTGGYSDYYGLCQWSVYYNPYIVGRDVQGQLDYLMSNIQGAFGSRYDAFLALTDAGEAARWFSDCYERPAWWATQRATNAYTALAWIQK